MPLRGELNSVDLAHIFQMLILNQKAGTLEIDHEGVKHQLLFTPAGLQVPFERELLVRRAVASLVRAGTIDASMAERARCNMAVLRKDQLATLVEMKAIDAATARQALREQLEEDVYELFFLTDASFEFRDGEEPSDAGELDEELALSPNGLIMEAARRVDEWEYIRRLVQSGADIVEVAGSLDQLDRREAGAVAAEVFAAIDGFSNVDEIIENTGISRFVVFRVIALFLDRGVAVSVAPERLVERAQECLEAGELQRAINLYERAIELGSSDVAVHAGAGQAYESVGRLQDAAERYLDAGRRSEEYGDLDSALKLYMRIRQLLPSQIEARERLFALRKVAVSHFEPGAYDPLKEGTELALVLYEIGRQEELALVLAGLLDLAGEDADRIEKVAQLAAKMAQVAFAVDALILASDQRALARDFPGAIRSLKRAQGLDPSRGGLQDRIDRLSSRIRQRRERRHSILRAVAMAVGFAVLFLGYGGYSQGALRAYGAYSLEDFLVTHDFEKGREHYQSIRRRYPLTIPFFLSIEKLRELEVAERNHAEVERYRSEVDEEQRERFLRQAAALKKQAIAARHTGDFAEALELLQRASALCGDNDPYDLRAAVKDLSDYLSEARRLASEAAFLRNAGRFELAHERLAKLASTYPNSPEARDVTLPVRITSQPPRARIAVDGEPVRIGDGRFVLVAETPFVLDLPPGRAVTVTLSLDGHADAHRRVDARLVPALDVEMPQRPDLESILPHEVLMPPSLGPEGVLAVLQRGRIAGLDRRTLEVKWNRELRDLCDVTGAPGSAPGAWLVPVSLGRVEYYGTDDGRYRGAVELAGRPRSAVVVADGRFAVLREDGALLIGDVAEMRLRRVVALPFPAVAGPVAAGIGRFAVGCEDGKVWLANDDGSLSSLQNPATVTGRISCLTECGTRLVFGDEGGALHAFRLPSGEHLATIQGPGGAPLVDLSPDERFVVAADGAALHLFDLASGVLVTSRTEGLRLARGTGPAVIASGPDGGIRVLDRSSLASELLYSAGSSIHFSGVMDRERCFFAAAGGRVAGILCVRR